MKKIIRLILKGIVTAEMELARTGFFLAFLSMRGVILDPVVS
jgi:hypothetical protein